MTALLGPNGAGKSTLLKAIAGLVRSKGRIELDGANLAHADRKERAKRIAYVPQSAQLSAPLAVRQVVELGRFPHRHPFAPLRSSDREAVASALRDARVEALADKPFTQLSGGEQQRVSLARALATGADALLLDEPTGNLDVCHALECHRVTRRLADRGAAVLMVLHDLTEARRYADHVVLLSEGAVHASGSPRAVVAATPVRDVYRVALVEGAGLGYDPLEGSR